MHLIFDRWRSWFSPERLKWGKVTSKFLSVQVVVQAIGFASGILLIRLLSTEDYAFFTIANTMQGAMNLLADTGVSIGLSSIGGRVWQDRHEFGRLIKTGLQLRHWLSFGVLLVILPIFGWMLYSNGASTGYGIAIVLSVVAGLFLQLTVGVLSIIPRISGHVDRLQRIDLASAITRMLLLVGASFLFLNAPMAVFIAALATVSQYLLLRRYAKKTVDMEALPDPVYRGTMLKLVRNQAPMAIFFCLQGQITVWLISIFGNTQSIAEVGALSRLAVLFSLIGSVIGNIFIPRFARCQNHERLKTIYFSIVAFAFIFAFAVLLLVFLFPGQVLWILGPKYKNLETALFLIIMGNVFNFVSGTIWSLNSSRAWVQYSWIYIPVTLFSQLAALPFVDLGNTTGVLLFGLAPLIPDLAMNFFFSYRGFRAFKTEQEKI